MNEPWDEILSALSKLGERVDVMPSIREASVYAASPLAVKFDTDSTPIRVYGSLVDGLSINDRVLTVKIKHYVWVIGTKNTSPDVVKGILRYDYLGLGDTYVSTDGGSTYHKYEWAAEYNPTGGREVTLVKSGNTYVVVGQTVTQVAIPLEHPFYPYNDSDVKGVWVDYPNASKLSSGLVVLSGLIYHSSTSGTYLKLTTLPEGYRPPYTQKIPFLLNNTVRCLDILPNGDVRMNGTVSGNGFISLDGISFYPAGVGDWVTVGSSGSGTSFGPGYRQHPQIETWGPVEYYEDPYGMVWWRGLIEITKSSSSDNDPMINIPSTLGQIYSAQLHVLTTGNNVMSAVGVGLSNIYWKFSSVSGIGSWISLSSVAYRKEGLPPKTAVWKPNWFNGSWKNYGSGFPIAEVFRREDGLCYSNGLLSSGSIGSRMFNMPPHFRSAKGDKILPAFSQGTESRIRINGSRVGADVLGAVIPEVGGGNFFSLDCIRWLPN